MNKIQYFLDKEDRSQIWLGKKIGRSNVTVNSWCKQKTQPNLNDLKAVSDLFNISIYELIDNNRSDRCKITMIEDETEQ